MLGHRAILLTAVCVCLGVALWQFPMRLALELAGFNPGGGMSLKRAQGSVWNAVLRDLSIGELSLGDVQARINLLRLITSGPNTHLRWQTKSTNGTARLSFKDGDVELSNIQSRLAIARTELTGIAVLEDGTIRLSPGGCISAQGTLTVNQAAQAEPLAGQLTCSNRALAFSMVLNGLQVSLPLVGP